MTHFLRKSVSIFSFFRIKLRIINMLNGERQKPVSTSSSLGCGSIKNIPITLMAGGKIENAK